MASSVEFINPMERDMLTSRGRKGVRLDLRIALSNHQNIEDRKCSKQHSAMRYWVKEALSYSEDKSKR
jgi:hypothetical protein